MQHDAAIPAELLELKARFDQWRATRKYNRQPIPDDLRQAAVEICRQHSPALVRRVLKLDPWRLNGRAAKQTQRRPSRKKTPTAFFKLPAEETLPGLASIPQTGSSCRLQLERPDGARLTFTLPTLDLASTKQLCADFLGG